LAAFAYERPMAFGWDFAAARLRVRVSAGFAGAGDAAPGTKRGC
jgi:hypothetical protein